jgi:hypothetical protein
VMEVNDNLFDLVKRLDEREYRFVVQFANCGRKRPEKVLELLSDLMKLGKYDQRLLEAKFTNLNITRFHLRQLIMRALRAYRDGESIDSQIRSLIEDYEILYEKGLYDEAFSSLKKAEKMAETHHRLDRKIEILHLQKHRLLELETKDLPTIIDERIEVLCKATQSYQDEMQMMNQYHQLFARYRTEERIDTVDGMQLFDGTLLDAEEVPFYTRLYGFMIAGLKARSKGDLATAKAYHVRTLALWDQFPEIKEDRQLNHKLVLANYAVYLFPEGNLEKVREILVQIQGIKDRSFNEEAETFQNVANLRLLLELNAKSGEDFKALVTEIEEGLEKYAVKINAARQFSIWYNLILLYLIHQDYRKAWEWIGRTLAHKRYQVRKEVQYITRLLELVVYHELEIWDTPEATVMAVYRYLSRKDQLTEFKREVLSHFTKLSSTPLDARQEVFEKLYQKLQSNGSSRNTADGLGLEVVTAWAGSKVTGKKILEMLQG